MMKKTKLVLSLLLCLFIFCSCIFAGCAQDGNSGTDQDPGQTEQPGDDGQTGDDGQEVVATEITLQGMRTEFEYGEAFSSDGMIVTIKFSDDSQRKAEQSEYTVDSSAYDAQTAGTYTISVKLNDSNVTRAYTVTVQEEQQAPYWSDDGALKILAIGNSFSDDMMEYAWQIATDLGIDEVVLGNLYIGGCTLDMHAQYALIDAAMYEYRTNTDGEWQTTKNYRMGDAIAAQDWDFISMQQASGSSGVADTYSRLNELIAYVREINDTAQLVWHMTWAYQQNSTHAEFSKYNNDQMTMYNSIISAVDSKILTNDAFSAVIPNATSVQNARTSFVGDNLTRDGYHLTYDLGRYIAGLTMIRTLTGLSVENISYVPSGLNDDYKKVAIESAENAVAEPFEVTPSAYEEWPVFDPEGYVLLDLEMQAFKFYNAAMANYDALFAGDAYYTSRWLTKSQLPVGSVIIVEEGWQYRPEAWSSNAPETARPNNVSIYRVDVTEEWWGDYIYRAFNLSKTDASSLREVDEEVVLAALKVYVPEDLYVEETMPDLENGYKLIDLDFTPFAFYNSAFADNYNTPILNSPAYYASKRFTKETLPVGSVIVLEKGWQYRPESWTADVVQTSRPSNTTAAYTIVTEEWWHGLEYRAFNLSKTDASSLQGIDEAVVLAALKVYVPEDLYVEETEPEPDL